MQAVFCFILLFHSHMCRKKKSYPEIIPEKIISPRSCVAERILLEKREKRYDNFVGGSSSKRRGIIPLLPTLVSHFSPNSKRRYTKCSGGRKYLDLSTKKGDLKRERWKKTVVALRWFQNCSGKNQRVLIFPDIFFGTDVTPNGRTQGCLLLFPIPGSELLCDTSAL